MEIDAAETRDAAQRTLERKALRNVRNLVDRLDEEQRAQTKLTMRFAAASIVVALVVASGAYLVLAGGPTLHAPVTSPR